MTLRSCSQCGRAVSVNQLWVTPNDGIVCAPCLDALRLLLMRSLWRDDARSSEEGAS